MLFILTYRSQINTDLAEAIGRMLTIDLKYHSAYRSEDDPKFFIFIDEFQTIASSYFVDIISKIRSANYCLVLANQSRGNLLNVSQAFHDAVMINSYTKLFLISLKMRNFGQRQQALSALKKP